MSIVRPENNVCLMVLIYIQHISLHFCISSFFFTPSNTHIYTHTHTHIHTHIHTQTHIHTCTTPTWIGMRSNLRLWRDAIARRAVVHQLCRRRQNQPVPARVQLAVDGTFVRVDKNLLVIRCDHLLGRTEAQFAAERMVV